ncbi:MAG: helix-turn-helix domain-containing protein [Candidatus Bathyarchaeota archaeon]|nr:MAG: helix-turn-helix domain-containing protein [Candidatus Bathyarchaeota archaeon]
MSSCQDAVPFYAVLDRYFPESYFWETLEKNPIPKLTLNKVASDFEQQRTMIFGVTWDEILREMTKDARLRTSKLYARPDFEYIPIQTLRREDLYTIEQWMKDLVANLEGEAFLDTVGRVSSYRDLLFWQRTISPEPTTVPGLSKEETRILEAAIAYGYYRRPRSINLEELAKKISMRKTTLSRRLREIEERIVNNALYEQLARRV